MHEYDEGDAAWLFIEPLPSSDSTATPRACDTSIWAVVLSMCQVYLASDYNEAIGRAPHLNPAAHEVR